MAKNGQSVIAIAMGLALAPAAATAEANPTVPDASSLAQAEPPAFDFPNGGDKPTKGSKRRSGNVRAMFNKAQKLYEKQKYQQALQAYRGILRQYPKHEPSITQMAKAYYRLDRIRDAYKMFRRVNARYLDPETSYEYGFSFYKQKKWKGALFAFKRVPKGHALYDLANYYGGVAAIKLKRYERAAAMLEQAVVLPDKLAKRKKLYVKHIDALQLIRKKKRLAQERNTARRQLRERLRRRRRARRLAQKAPPPEEKSAYDHGGFKSISKTATVKYAFEHQFIGYHGFREKSYDSRVGAFELYSGPSFILPGYEDRERRPLTGLQVMLKGEDRLKSGDEQRIIIDERDEDLSRVLNEDLGTTHEQSGIVSGEPWVEIPLPSDVWFALGGKVYFKYPEFERGGRVGYREAYTSLSGLTDRFTFETELNYTEFLDTETRPAATRLGVESSLTVSVAEDLEATGKLQHQLYDYLVADLELDGPDSATSVSAELIQSLPFGFEIGGSGSYEFQAGHVFHGIPSYGRLAADGQIAIGKAYLTATPWPWLSAEISQKVSQRNWALDANEDVQETFEINVPDYLEEFSAQVALNLSF